MLLDIFESLHSAKAISLGEIHAVIHVVADLDILVVVIGDSIIGLFFGHIDVFQHLASLAWLFIEYIVDLISRVIHDEIF